VTSDRARRLYQLVKLLGTGPQSRVTLIRALRLDVRGFYRDLGTLRKAGVRIAIKSRRYQLRESTEEAVRRLPLPDAGLTVGEALILSKGRTPAHKKLRRLISEVVKKS
jgi:predicted DNA-binding transcriptional regulator YafY